MKQTAINYAKALYEPGIPENIVFETKKIFLIESKLKLSLISPLVSKKSKYSIIEKVFPKEIHGFLKILCDYNNIVYVEDIFIAYKNYYNEQNGILEAKIICVTAPDINQLDAIKALLMKMYNKKHVKVILEVDPNIIGGFIIKTNNYEIDWSIKGRIDRLQQRLVRR